MLFTIILFGVAAATGIICGQKLSQMISYALWKPYLPFNKYPFMRRWGWRGLLTAIVTGSAAILCLVGGLFSLGVV